MTHAEGSIDEVIAGTLMRIFPSGDSERMYIGRAQCVIGSLISAGYQVLPADQVAVQ